MLKCILYFITDQNELEAAQRFLEEASQNNLVILMTFCDKKLIR